jgi:tRNA threonylcarbamoyladenosine biosynthesis protein TsaE
VFHFDAYRLGGPEPFEALGVSEYWDAGGVCFVEWADLVLSLLPEGAWRVRIEPTGAGSRRFVIAAPDVTALAGALADAGR